MLRRKYIFPNVIEMNYQAGRRLGVNVYLVDGGNGEYALIGELGGAVSVLDKEGKLVARLGLNEEKGETGNNNLEPAKWRPGFVTAPHGVAFNGVGDIFVSEYNKFGRVHRWNKL